MINQWQQQMMIQYYSTNSLTNFSLEQPNAYCDISLEEAALKFLDTIESPSTKKSYQSCLKGMFDRGFIARHQSLREFSQDNIDLIVMAIKADDNKLLSSNQIQDINYSKRSPLTRQKILAIFSSFTTFLEKYTNSRVKKVQNKKIQSLKREKTVATILSKEEIKLFLTTIEALSTQAYFIACMQIQGGRRITEALQLNIENICFKENVITFNILKKKNLINKAVSISFPSNFIEKIGHFIGKRKNGYLFINSTTNKHITYNNIVLFYQRAFKLALPGKRICMISHCLRGTAFTQMLKALPIEKVVEISGHEDLKTLNYYNKGEESTIESTKMLNIAFSS